MIKHKSSVYEMCDNPSDSNVILDRLISNETETNCSQTANFDTIETIKYRTTSIHRNKYVSTSTRTCQYLETNRRKIHHFVVPKNLPSEEIVQYIFNALKTDSTLMENSLESEALRKKYLRDLPQPLTIKKTLKSKINFSLVNIGKYWSRDGDKNTGVQASFYAGVEQNYRHGRIVTKNAFHSFIYMFVPWYDSVKTIEGHFGSGVSAYFTFFRGLFLANCAIAAITFFFIALPQYLYTVEKRNKLPEIKSTIYEAARNLTLTILPVSSQEDGTDIKFGFTDIFTGEGYFSNSCMYYGYYTNGSVDLNDTHSYSIPYAYFFTNIFIYLASFIGLSLSMARSYRKTFIKTQCGLKNVFAKQLFCSWDFSMATLDAAQLKSYKIYRELQALVNEDVENLKQITCLRQFWTYVVRVVIHSLTILVLGLIGYLIWYLLDKHLGDVNDSVFLIIITAVIINLIVSVFPAIFSYVARYEDYRHSRGALYMTLFRTFMLKMVLVGALLVFWTTRSMNRPCWENRVAQQIYRLILFNFLFSVIFSAFAQVFCYVLHKRFPNKIDLLECNMVHHAIQMMYTQSLLWIGLFFSPPLASLIVVTSWITWYVRRACILKFNKPSLKTWRAAHMETYLLIFSFLSLLLILITLGYIIVSVSPSSCGPFRNYEFIYQLVLNDILKLKENGVFWKLLVYVTRPGMMAIFLIAMSVAVYYLRAKAHAEGEMANLLKKMLIDEAKDKEFLLRNILGVKEEQKMLDQNRGDCIESDQT